MDEPDILNYFPNHIKIELSKYIDNFNYNLLEEIRIRVNI